MALFFPRNQNLFSVVLVILTTSFVLVNSQQTVSFDITNFSNSKSSISLQGSATILPNGVVSIANPDESATGRVLYTTPVPIWDKTTGKVASFITTFVFKVENYKTFTPADGFVFNLLPQDRAQIPSNSNGGNLGVVDGNSGFNQFVGVEFDNYANQWDPQSTHVGIDVNSLFSLNTVKWNRVSGSLVRVMISYDSPSKTLNVVVFYPDGKFSTIAQVIDLKQVLPDTVRIGFSAATSSGGRQLHHIHSWSFRSNFDAKTTTTSDNIASI